MVYLLSALAAAGPASAQTIPDDFKNIVDLKYKILQEQADTDRMRAETERTRAQAEGNAMQRSRYSSGGNIPTSYATYSLPIDHDSLVRVHPPTFRLGNGVILQMTGIFWPDAFTVCIENCN